MLFAARLIGLLIVAQGILGLAAPALFFGVVQAFQVPPVLYLAAVIRVAFGIVLLRAAKLSRARVGMLLLGGLILAGGLLTPFFGAQFAHVVLGWWSEGGAVVIRAWATASLVLGLFIAYATLSRRPAA